MVAGRHILVLFALARELEPFRRQAGLVPHPTRPGTFDGLLGEIRLSAAVGGMGGPAMAAECGRLLPIVSPDLLIVAGVGGALCPRLEIGEVVVADRVVPEVPDDRPDEIPSPLGGAPELRRGCFLSSDRVLSTAAEKAAATARWNSASRPILVEMETLAAARVAARLGVPWSAVRAVSDRAEEDMPLDFNPLRSQNGSIPTTRVAVATLTRPWSIPGLLRLGRNTALAAEHLASALVLCLSDPSS